MKKRDPFWDSRNWLSTFSFSSKRSLLALLSLIVFTLIAWGGVPWGSFQFDDFSNVVRDPATTDAHAFGDRLLHGLRPLTRLSYFLDAHLFGLKPSGFLSSNLLLHIATVLLVFGLARRRLDFIGAYFAALFFALQPANAEVIAYVSGRSSGLMTPLLIGGLLAHDYGHRIGSFILFLLACLAKEVALIFPALVFLWEITRTDRPPNFRKDVIALLVVAIAIFALLFSLSNYRSMIAYSVELRSIQDNLLANGRAIPQMISLWVRPWALSPDHDFDTTNHIIVSIAGLVLIAIVLVFAFRLRHRNPSLALALAWPVVALLPTNSIIAKIDLVTERPLYLAWVGPCIGLGAGVSLLLSRTNFRVLRRLVQITAMILVCTLASASYWRAWLWRNPILLWQDAAEKARNKSRCWNNLGMAYLNNRRDPEAVAAFERAVRLEPENQLAETNLKIARSLCGDACSQN